MGGTQVTTGPACGACGRSVSSTARFCGRCGTPVPESASTVLAQGARPFPITVSAPSPTGSQAAAEPRWRCGSCGVLVEGSPQRCNQCGAQRVAAGPSRGIPQAAESSPSPYAVRERDRRKPARRRSAAWVYYAILSILGIVGLVGGAPTAPALILIFICGLYAFYLFRGGSIVVWFW